MIKEYIEDLPGGKEFININRFIGITVGTFIGTLVGTLSGIMFSTDENRVVGFIVIILFLVVLPIVGIVEYYQKINKINNIFMKNYKGQQ